jgi:hypothetical protein
MALNTDRALAPRDLAKILKSMNSQVMMLRKRVAQHERDRLQSNYNKVPKDIRYLTDKEIDLKKELVQAIEKSEEYLVGQE